jgi:phytoene dehydrogenase-like protein
MTKNIVVVGGGIAGLVAATQAARTGASVTLLEKAAALGGRATTRDRHGFLFNLGPHALYRLGALRQTLHTFGIDPKGAIPGGNGGFAIYQGRRHTLPTGLTSLLTTGLLTLPAKLEFATLLTAIRSIGAATVAAETLDSWLERHIRHTSVREVVKMLVRVTTFTNDPTRQSAGAAIEQLQLGAKGNVLYLDGGWQTIVEALRQKALASGVAIRTGSPAVAIERRGLCAADAVRLADGSHVPATAVILTGAPSEVDAIAGTRYGQTLPPPVRVATLDIGLRSLPNPKRLVAFGVDVPLYFSVHSAVARLAPAGAALIHVSQYLKPDEHADGRVERALEQLVDDLQPGWRNVLAARQFVPNLTVTNAEVTAAQNGLGGRPPTRVGAFSNVFVAGDWVGPRGQLSDAAAASAMDAAAAAIRDQPAVGHHQSTINRPAVA